jgi:hypothetical protein
VYHNPRSENENNSEKEGTSIATRARDNIEQNRKEVKAWWWWDYQHMRRTK